MKFIGSVISAMFFTLIGYLTCYFNWLPVIIEFFKDLFNLG